MTVERLETNYGPMFIPSTDNGQYWWLRTTGASPEDDLIEIVCGLLAERPRRGVSIDCGANFGCWSLPLARVSTKVIAFEPQRCVFGLLTQTLAANGLPVEAHNLALGPLPGTIKVPDLDINSDSNFGGIALGIPHSEHPEVPMYDVEVVRLDDIVGDTEDVMFIKADVEGSEMGLFRGATETIRRCRPIIIAEADHPLTDTKALGEFIESLGYNVEIAIDNNFIAMPV